ncbi:hypothetical protein IAT38_000700 [Cryptococcus sp. DSM 104549]
MSIVSYEVVVLPSDTAPTDPPAAAVAPETATDASAPTDPAEIRAQVDKLVAEGKKAIALRQWEQGVEAYADALDAMRLVVGDFHPQMAPLLLSYGKALYELASSQAGVMGKEEAPKVEEPQADPSSNPNFVFSADPASDDEGDDAPAAEAGASSAPATDAPAPEGGNAEEIDEPEDDYNAAWEVLDVARTIYQKIVDGLKEGEGKEERLLLAECYLSLGNVSCETENFSQATQDFTSALDIQTPLLPASSRTLASGHYQLATALEFTPNQRPAALTHVEAALSACLLLKAELESSDPASQSEEVARLTPKEREADLKDVAGLIGDLEAKIEELKVAPPAEDLVHESISHLMGQDAEGSGAAKAESGPVNDLTGMVKKKKPKKVAGAAAAAPAAVEEKAAEEMPAAEKRPAEETDEERSAKKAKAE